MDPYKVLGISASQVKHESDLDKVRHRTKKLYKRYGKEGKKFDAKKVLEAFELVKQRLKSRPGEGQYKILGRSRKERELDRHFNHQTKEIKNDKNLKAALRKARHGTGKERLHLPGDKERIPRQRRRRHGRDRRRRREKMKKRQTDVNILEGLRRLAVFLPQEQKFPKVIKLLYRWMKDYMNLDTREDIFKVLDGVAQCEFLTDDPDSRQDIIQVFEYVLTYFKEWFDRGHDTSMLHQQWHVATVLACQCYTDDPFVLSSVIIKLTKAFELLEKHREEIGVDPKKLEAAKKEEDRMKKEDDDFEQAIKRAKLEKAKEEDDDSVKSEDGSVKEEDDDTGPTCKEECKEEVAEDKQASNGKVKTEDKAGKRPLMAKPLIGMGMAAPVVAGPSPMDAAAASPSPNEDDLEVLSSGSGDVCELDSDEEVVGVDSGGSDEDLEEIEIDDEGDADGDDAASVDQESSGEVEEVEGSIWPTPSPGKSLELVRAHFVDRCLATLFLQRGPMWARPKIDAFFQEVFYRRSVFNQEQQTQVEAWQSRIKTSQRDATRSVGEANNPLEAHRPVVDSREMRTVFDSDSNSWAAKQTFDSREASAGKVIR